MSMGRGRAERVTRLKPAGKTLSVFFPKGIHSFSIAEAWALGCFSISTLLENMMSFFFFFFFFVFEFYFIFKLYITVLVLPNIKMNPPQVYMYSPSRTPLPPPSPFHPSGSFVPVHQPQASSIVHRTWTGNSFHTWYFTCFNDELLDTTKGILGKTKTKQKDWEDIHVEKSINSKCDETKKKHNNYPVQWALPMKIFFFFSPNVLSVLRKLRLRVWSWRE